MLTGTIGVADPKAKILDISSIHITRIPGLSVPTASSSEERRSNVTTLAVPSDSGSGLGDTAVTSLVYKQSWVRICISLVKEGSERYTYWFRDCWR